MDRLALHIHAISYAAEGILLFDLRAPRGAELPPFTAGAHVDVHLEAGMVRSYSLVNSAHERHRYVIGVKRDPASRGGSAWMHGAARVGQTVDVSAPRNNFALQEQAAFSVFLAGGIGITPLWSMIQRLERLQRPWALHYGNADAASAAFLDALQAPERKAHVHLAFSEAGTPRMDLGAIVRAAPAGSHFYCCGPAGMLDAFELACSGLDPSRVHLERFRAPDPAADGDAFIVRLARTGITVAVPPGLSILEALEARGVNVPFSCREGVCGACETRVLAGTPEHRDQLLSQAERATGTSMMVCCSRASSSELVLDL